MMLGQPHRVKTELLGKLRLRDRLIDDAFIPRRIAALRKQEVAEFHARLPFGHRECASTAKRTPKNRRSRGIEALAWLLRESFSLARLKPLPQPSPSPRPTS